MLFGILVVLFVLVCLILCFLVLIQSDKGGGISSAIGGGLASASSLLGTQDTANILTRGTTIFASAFMVLCIVLSFLATNASRSQQGSLLKKRAETQETYSPSSILQGQDGGLQLAPEGQSGSVGAAPVVPAPENP
jgi:preprotein translocase subunit SecG